MTLTISEAGTIDESWGQRLPPNQDKAEVRFYAVVLTGFFIADLLEPIIYGAGVSASMLFRVIALTHFPMLVLALFGLLAALVMPHFVSLLFMPRFLACRAPRKMACAAACCTALLWAWLGTLAQPLDAGALPYLYWFKAAGTALLAGVFALSLNTQLLRKVVDEARQAG